MISSLAAIWVHDDDDDGLKFLKRNCKCDHKEL